MEHVRKFERTCLRAALNMYRTSSSNFLHRFSNKILYDIADIPRIDTHILNLTRNYLANLLPIENQITKSFTFPRSDYKEKSISGHFPPQYFTYFDCQGLIQDINIIPIIYHISRHKANKDITYNIRDCKIPSINMKYNTKIPKKRRG